jgi:hypothetical protein
MKSSIPGGPHDRTLHELRNPDRPRASHKTSLTGLSSLEKTRMVLIMFRRTTFRGTEIPQVHRFDEFR